MIREHLIDGSELLALSTVDDFVYELTGSHRLPLGHLLLLLLGLPLLGLLLLSLPLLCLSFLLCLLGLLALIGLLLLLRLLGELLLVGVALLLLLGLLSELLLSRPTFRLLRLLTRRDLLELDLRLLLCLLVLDARLTHLLDVHLWLLGALDGRLDTALRRQHLNLRLCGLDLDLRLLPRLGHGNLRLRHLHLNLRLRHLHVHLRLRHSNGNLRLRLLDRYGRRWNANENLRLRLLHRDLRLRLLDPDAGCRRCDLHLWRLLLHDDARLLLPLLPLLLLLSGLLLCLLTLLHLLTLLALLLLLQSRLLHLLKGVLAGPMVPLRRVLACLLQANRSTLGPLLEVLDKLVTWILLLGLELLLYGGALLALCLRRLPRLHHWLRLLLPLLRRLHLCGCWQNERNRSQQCR